MESDEQLTITPVEIQRRFRIRDDRGGFHRAVLVRWLDRLAHRQGCFVNIPSLRVQADRDPARQQTYLYASIDAVPIGSPPWLATAMRTGASTVRIER